MKFNKSYNITAKIKSSDGYVIHKNRFLISEKDLKNSNVSIDTVIERIKAYLISQFKYEIVLLKYKLEISIIIDISFND